MTSIVGAVTVLRTPRPARLQIGAISGGAWISCPCRSVLVTCAAGVLTACSTLAHRSSGQPHAEQVVAQWTVDSASAAVAADLEDPAVAGRVRPVGALSLDGGRTAVLDGNAPRLLYFDRDGTLEHSTELQPPGSGPRVRPQKLVRISGDSLGVLAGRKAFVLNHRGVVVRTFDAAELRAPGMPRLRVVLALLTGGRTVLGIVGAQEPPSTGLTRWTDSMRVVVVDSNMTVANELGRWPTVYLEARDGQPRQVWFAPHGVFSSRDSVIYYGFGSDYRIDAYTAAGTRHRSYSRPWTRVQVTLADIDAYIEGWGRNWMKGSAAEVERQNLEMQGDPFFPHVPAFSELVVAADGDLWVRTPSLTDAQTEGELHSVPLVPSHWSIFDPDGQWTGEATLPAFSHPRDVRDGFVLSTEAGTNAGKVLRRRLERVR